MKKIPGTFYISSLDIENFLDKEDIEVGKVEVTIDEINKEFKDSFPSTNMKCLQDCYDKDFSAIVAEFCFDEIPFLLRSIRSVISNPSLRIYLTVKGEIFSSARNFGFFT